MKKILNILLKNIGSLAVGTFLLSANTTSNWMSYQPKVPNDINRFKKYKEKDMQGGTNNEI